MLISHYGLLGTTGCLNTVKYDQKRTLELLDFPGLLLPYVFWGEGGECLERKAKSGVSHMT